MPKNRYGLQSKGVINELPNLAVLVTLSVVIARVVMPAARQYAEDSVIEPWGLEGSAADNMGYRPFMLLGLTLAYAATDIGLGVVMGLLRGLVMLISTVYPSIYSIIDNKLDRLFNEHKDVGELPLQVLWTDKVATLTLAPSKFSRLHALHDAVLVIVPSMLGTLRQHVNSAAWSALTIAVEQFVRNEMVLEVEKDIAAGKTPPTPAEINATADKYGQYACVAAAVIITFNFLEVSKRSVLRLPHAEQESPQGLIPSLPHASNRNYKNMLSWLVRTLASVNFKASDRVFNPGLFGGRQAPRIEQGPERSEPSINMGTVTR